MLVALLVVLAGSVLASGMSPEKIGQRVVRAIETGDFYVFTHPEWKRLAEPQIAEMLAAFGEFLHRLPFYGLQTPECICGLRRQMMDLQFAHAPLFPHDVRGRPFAAPQA